jgi:WS/DGAT/MGAT family acyltransferase
MAAMKHLSALDALFLQLETPDTPMHVGSLMRMAAPKGVGRGRSAYDQIRAHMEGRLHLAPIFSRRLAFMPLDLANPIWIDAEQSISTTTSSAFAFPLPAAMRSSRPRREAARRDARSRAPLVAVHVIEGLPDGEVGVYAKIHHAALDGQGGIAGRPGASRLSSRSPRGARGRSARAAPAASPPRRMIGAALRNTVSQYGRLASRIPEALKAAGAAARSRSIPRRFESAASRWVRARPQLRDRPARVFATTRLPLSEAKAIARHFEAKLNDVVLATCAGRCGGTSPEDKAALAKAMIGAVPGEPARARRHDAGQLRDDDVRGLATNVADPVKRLEAIKAASARAKMLTGSLKGAIPTDLPSLGIPWLMSALTPLYQKAAAADEDSGDRQPRHLERAGPPIPLYMAGGRVKAYFPVSAVAHGLALNITILSYDGSLDYGLVAAREAMPKLRGFAGHLARRARRALSKAAGRMSAKPPVPCSSRSKRALRGNSAPSSRRSLAPARRPGATATASSCFRASPPPTRARCRFADSCARAGTIRAAGSCGATSVRARASSSRASSRCASFAGRAGAP